MHNQTEQQYDRTTMHSERLHARGPKGEACTIIRFRDHGGKDQRGEPDAQAEAEASYRLASGERLVETDDPKVFETPDRKRRFQII